MRNIEEEISEVSSDYDTIRVIERPDGFYRENKKTGVESGPFLTVAEAMEDWEFSAGEEGDDETIEALLNAEDELHISDWIDLDTGMPAEEHVPHLADR